MTYALPLPPLHAGDARDRRDAVARRVLAAAFAFSLLIHGAALWEWLPRLGPVAFDLGQAPPDHAPLTAQLATRPRELPSETVTPPAPPAAAPSPPRQPSPAKPAPRPPVIAAERSPAPPIAAPIEPMPLSVPAPAPPLAPSPLVPPTPAPAPTSPPAIAQSYPDLSAYVAERRRARGEPATGSTTPREDENARINRIVSANLASINAPTFGAAQRNTGGLFQITALTTDSAEFTFFGWNRDIQRRASQRIEVRRDSHGDIRLAVVRKMISIIREYEQEDFTWRSNRLGRDVTLSARVSDTAGLEEFMLREFFDVSRVPG